MAPSDERECQLMLNTGHQHNGPSIVRYPRGNGIGATLPNVDEIIEIGKAKQILTGEKIVMLSFGTMLEQAKIAATELKATLIDMRFVKPLDRSIIDQAVAHHDVIVTIEDNAIAGGAGSGVNEYILAKGQSIKVLNIGVADHFVKHGTQPEIHKELGLDSVGLVRQINAFIN
jgi:1-deoxy-D-xylulose-5-phosphate synthase